MMCKAHKIFAKEMSLCRVPVAGICFCMLAMLLGGCAGLSYLGIYIVPKFNISQL